ncbi:MAG: right-handed parallel beta-helix repeat-containing protein [Planctomycetes bacterium]|nr:right-handed parallel beta-helix repeat-containing protein [Planctomycetota bacterium]
MNKSLTIIGGWLGHETGNTLPQGCPALTVLDGNLGSLIVDCDNSFHVVSITGGPGSKVALSRVTIINGKAKASAAPCNGVFLPGVLDPRNCGAGIYIKSRSTVSLSELILQENSCIGLGAGLYANGCSLSIAQAVMRTNTAKDTPDGGGSAMYLNCPVARIANTVVLGNGLNTARGGGLYAAGGDMEFTNCVFTENHADTGSGSAVYLEGAVYARFFNCTLSHNFPPLTGAESIDMSTLAGECLLMNTIVFTNNSTVPHFVAPAVVGKFQSASCYLQIIPGQPGPSADFSAIGYPTIYFPAAPPAAPVQVLFVPGGLSLDPQTGVEVRTKGDPALVPADILDIDQDGNTTEQVWMDRERGLRFSPQAGGATTVSMGAYEIPYTGLLYYLSVPCSP